MKTYDIIVVGAGAAGLFAAGVAAQNGASVLLLEKMKMAGRKLRITGKGRCNLTNIAPMGEFLKHIGKNSKFLRPAFSTFFSEDLVNFFEGKGVKTVTERGGRVFPASDEAREIAETLLKWNEQLEVKIMYQSPVDKILVDNGNVKGIRSNGNEWLAKAVIIATGGASYPATGSSGDGYKLAKSVGHTVQPVRPALVPFETEGDVAQQLQGVSLKNVNVNVWIDDKKHGEAFGEMLFTHFGISGPIVLTLSRNFVEPVQSGKKVIFSIDLKPALDEKKLDERLLRDLKEHSSMKMQSLLRLLMPQKMVQVCLDLLHFDAEKPAHQISADERRRLRIWLKDFRLNISQVRGFNEAIITAGGVTVDEINPDTMESKVIQNLYFAGELIDVDADTGGYNLQIAFSTGNLAAISAVKKLRI